MHGSEVVFDRFRSGAEVECRFVWDAASVFAIQAVPPAYSGIASSVFIMFVLTGQSAPGLSRRPQPLPGSSFTRILHFLQAALLALPFRLHFTLLQVIILQTGEGVNTDCVL
jgi:hypothetical protein